MEETQTLELADTPISQLEVAQPPLTSLAPEVRFSISTQETTTSYSTATIPGIGMVSGRAIKKLGERTIEFAQNTRIRWRLIVIKNTIRTKPDAFWRKPNQEALDIIEDLKEFIHHEYPESIRRDAHLLTRSLSIRQELLDVGTSLHAAPESRWGRPDQESETRIQHADQYNVQRVDTSPEFRPPESQFVSSSSQNGTPYLEPSFTKRQHALFKLLESERAYASDLALVREVYIPLALGHPVLESSSSPASSQGTLPDSLTLCITLPMTAEDMKIIFNNIADLAMFSDMFCGELELAMGLFDEEDAVGSLFLQVIPQMQQPFKTYITRHRAADEHLRSLPKTPALEAYHAKVRSFASSISHTWDLHSLLIKPIQRLLIYPLLLSAIISETPDSHPDKENLKLACSKIEAFARNINEDCRRAEVVKDVLSSKSDRKSRLPAPFALARIKLINSPYRLADMDEETALVAQLSTELGRVEMFAHTFTRHVLDWGKSMSVLAQALRTWAYSFAKVIGLSEENNSESLDGFLKVIERSLVRCATLQTDLNKDLLKGLANLLTTMHEPMKLIGSMKEQEVLHFQVLLMNVQSLTTRPPQTLLEASSTYLALRSQLASDLPRYLTLMDHGISCLIIKLAEIQKSFYGDVRDYWRDFWEMMRVEGEVLAGADETIGVWWARWQEVDLVVSSLAITKAKYVHLPNVLPPPLSVTQPKSTSLNLAHSPTVSLPPPPLSATQPKSASLNPAHSPTVSVSPSNMTSNVSRPRRRRSWDPEDRYWT